MDGSPESLSLPDDVPLFCYPTLPDDLSVLCDPDLTDEHSMLYDPTFPSNDSMLCDPSLPFELIPFTDLCFIADMDRKGIDTSKCLSELTLVDFSRE